MKEIDNINDLIEELVSIQNELQRIEPAERLAFRQERAVAILKALEKDFHVGLAKWFSVSKFWTRTR